MILILTAKMRLSKILQIAVLSMLTQSYPLGSLEGKGDQGDFAKCEDQFCDSHMSTHTSARTRITKPTTSKSIAAYATYSASETPVITAIGQEANAQMILAKKANDGEVWRNPIQYSKLSYNEESPAATISRQHASDGSTRTVSVDELVTNSKVARSFMHGIEFVGELAGAGAALDAFMDDFDNGSSTSSSSSSSSSSAYTSSSTCSPTLNTLCPVGDGTYRDSRGDIYNSVGVLISSATVTAIATVTVLRISTATA
ncbi:hypothetical protein DASC09_010360 [Saccharomycopsis crataegensis]|uniref:Uncharacterized protein n=1 Tax=Saccharomycopsis crataegensis TaxID=43959 RepID=A0AAV5QG69_9ASCO|nr:hypothetical protein DASC09_010360 [Saccharomycopsis crataegensis]